jgi:molecular chaperone DnaJ
VAGVDYYRVLGLSPGASAEEIKSAYRRLALELHPDHNGGDSVKTRRFVGVDLAYQTLSDPAKRAAHGRGRSPTALVRPAASAPPAPLKPADAGLFGEVLGEFLMGEVLRSEHGKRLDQVARSKGVDLRQSAGRAVGGATRRVYERVDAAQPPAKLPPKKGR